MASFFRNPLFFLLAHTTLQKYTSPPLSAIAPLNFGVSIDSFFFFFALLWDENHLPLFQVKSSSFLYLFVFVKLRKDSISSTALFPRQIKGPSSLPRTERGSKQRSFFSPPL